MMRNRLLLIFTILFTTFSLFACGGSQTTDTTGENTSGMEEIPIVATYEPFLEHYEKIVDVQGNLFITNMDRHYPVYATQDYDDETHKSYHFVLGADITDELTQNRRLQVMNTLTSATLISQSSLSLLSNGDLINRKPFTSLTGDFKERYAYSYVYSPDYLLLNQLMGLDPDETVIDFSLGDRAVTVLTSKHRVLTFGKNDEGQLLDGLKQKSLGIVTDRFVDITGNFPLDEDETIIALDHYYFLTSKNRIFIRDYDYENKMQKITLYSDDLPLDEQETITDVYMTMLLRGVSTSQGRFLIENKQPLSIQFENEEIGTLENLGFYDVFDYLPLGDDESIIKIKTYEHGLVFFTDQPRVLHLSYDVQESNNENMSMVLHITRFDEGMVYLEGETPVAVFKTDVQYTYNRPDNTMREFLLTSEGRLLVRTESE